MHSLVIHCPDDWHVHLRDGVALQHTVAATAQHFSRALIMPNLKPALTELSALLSYRNRILAATPKNRPFTPYMTFYLNESVAPEELEQAAALPCILGAKLYPAGATTNSQEGIKSFKTIYPLLDLMQENDLVLQIHGEVTHSDLFEREARFIDEHLKTIIKHFPKLRIILEHISTQRAVEFIMDAPERVAATITPHHLLYNRNHLLAGGIKPHYYCLPILKQETDQNALKKAVSSGHHKFFAGTDSAPHSKQTKENACGCAGIYSAPFALALYAQLFDELGQLKRLNHFTSRFGAEFYQLPVNDHQITLVKSPQTIPHSMPFGEEWVVPIAAGETINWKIHDEK